MSIMKFSSPRAVDAVTVLVNGPGADQYAARARAQFPHVRVVTAADADSLDRHIGGADVLLASRFPVEVFNKARRLRWFQFSKTGIDSVLPLRDRLGELLVTNARGTQSEIIADFVMAGITMMHWDFPRLMREQCRKEWRQREVAPLAQRTVGVVGLGSIGAAIPRRARSAGMTVVGSKRNVSEPVPGVNILLPPERLDDLLVLSDFVVLAVPHVPETIGLIGRNQLRLMRRTAFLVNIARGSVVVEDELVDELRLGTIGGALLDVFEREPLPVDSSLWTMSNVIVTPHIRNVVDVKRGY
ncbi:D-2-hydroxyacid dehydrogenase [Bradyrhizobium tropiciagri]|uniref:D-2-hydroxyacid dehydrogenase n=1 Tax=Bradyrhizobium tropiciagri TaxID=312253 RepID=UPI00067AE76C|nr:D-2-hydroxyacid dehydrogenase [Bradyrhizobium tropiciagri]